MVDGQDLTRTISGIAVDATTGEPVVFASVGSMDSPLSTVTNLDGKFTFIFPINLGLDSISITSIGYQLKTISLVLFKKENPLSIKLDQSETFLDVVTVLDSLTGNEIMALTAQKMKQNHTDQPVSMEVFYRERQILDGAYVSLVEAALTIYDEYNIKKRKSALRTKVRVDQLRRSLVYKHPYNSWWQQDNLMMLTWRFNPIPYASRTLEKSAKNNEFKRVSMTTVLGKNAFVIESDNKDFWTTTYYVQTGTYAIVRIEENFDEDIDEPKHWQMEGDSLLLDVYFKKRHVVVDFKMINNKYHPTFIQLDAKHDYYLDGKFLTQFGIIQDFVVNELNYANPVKVERNEASRIGKSLLSKEYPYNPAFWKIYNTLQETPLETKLIADLESKIPLEEQFISNQHQQKK